LPSVYDSSQWPHTTSDVRLLKQRMRWLGNSPRDDGRNTAVDIGTPNGRQGRPAVGASCPHARPSCIPWSRPDYTPRSDLREEKTLNIRGVTSLFLSGSSGKTQSEGGPGRSPPRTGFHTAYPPASRTESKLSPRLSGQANVNLLFRTNLLATSSLSDETKVVEKKMN